MIFTDFIKSAELSNLMEIRPVGDELLHVDDKTNELNSRFSQFCERD